MDEERYKIKVVSQQKQGRWKTWEAVINRAVTWADVCRIPQARLSFLIRATHDTPFSVPGTCTAGMTQRRPANSATPNTHAFSTGSEQQQESVVPSVTQRRVAYETAS